MFLASDSLTLIFVCKFRQTFRLIHMLTLKNYDRSIIGQNSMN